MDKVERIDSDAGFNDENYRLCFGVTGPGDDVDTVCFVYVLTVKNLLFYFRDGVYLLYRGGGG